MHVVHIIRTECSYFTCIFVFLVGTCPGNNAPPANGMYMTLEGDDPSVASPNVGSVFEVVCNPGYEQTQGLPFYVCQTNGQTGVWNGDLVSGATRPACSRESLLAEL